MSIDNLLKEFFAECYENLDQLDRDFVELEKNPKDHDRLASIFRKIHTMKGSAAFLGFSKLEALAHAGENLLSRLRDGKFCLTPEIATVLLSLMDTIRNILTNIETSGIEADTDYSSLISLMNHYQEEVTGDDSVLSKPDTPIALPTINQAKTTPPATHADFVEKSPGLGSISGEQKQAILNQQASSLQDHQTDGELLPTSSLPGAHSLEVNSFQKPMGSEVCAEGSPSSFLKVPLESATKPMGQLLVAEGLITQKEVEGALNQQNFGDPRRIGEILVERGDIRPETVRVLLEQQKGKPERLFAQEGTIRVTVGVLDQLMNLAGELVLARNQILQYATTQTEDTYLIGAAQRLGLHITELQEKVMKARMQPIRTIWNNLHRLARDLEKTCGKKVHLEMAGEETELDRTLIETIKDPLTHIIRNAIDHGIETSAARMAQGKQPEGRIILRAFHKGSQVHIEIVDDGAGIDPNKIKQRAIALNLITKTEAGQMNAQQTMHLLFLPGFSTSETVTNISGRGVGMDVLKTNIERIGGTIDIQSQVNQGTTIKLKIPLTLAIIPVLLVSCDGYRYAIPKMSLIELVLLKEEEALHGIEFIHGTPVYRLRGKLLPLVYLREALDKPMPIREEPTNTEDLAINIVVVQADDHQFGLVVDQVFDTEEIVVKAFGKLLKGIPIFAGATVLGDGAIALILDVVGMAQSAGILSDVRDKLHSETASVAPSPTKNEQQSLLLVKTSDNGRLGIPLASVTRLERFQYQTLENIGSTEVIQYRDQVLPLVHLKQVLAERRGNPRNLNLEACPLLHVVVLNCGNHLQGLVVDQILDIVEADITTKHPPTRKGILFTTIIQERVTEILDVEYLTQRRYLRPNKTRRHRQEQSHG